MHKIENKLSFEQTIDEVFCETATVYLDSYIDGHQLMGIEVCQSGCRYQRASTQLSDQVRQAHNERIQDMKRFMAGEMDISAMYRKWITNYPLDTNWLIFLTDDQEDKLDTTI